MSLIAAIPAPPRIKNQPSRCPSVGRATASAPKANTDGLGVSVEWISGDDYVLVGNQLVIVDAAVRRVVAIIPEVAPT